MCNLFGWPKPTGPFPVGTTAWNFVDPLRADPFAREGEAGPAGLRAVMVNVWYPAQASPGAKRLSGTVGFPEGGLAYPRPPLTLLTRAGALPDTLKWLVEHYKLPGAVLHQVTHLNTFALPEAIPAAGDERWPVLLFSHGYGLENAVSDSYLTESLASHGYVVVSVSHPGESLATVFPDGRVVTLDIDHPRLDLAARLDEIESGSGPWGERATQSLDLWAADLGFVLDELQRLNTPSLDNPLTGLAGRLDLEHVGVAGIGFGGTAALEFAARDARIRAATSMGGRVVPGSTSLGERPSMFISNQTPSAPADWSPTHTFTLHGAKPLHFTGAALWFPQLEQVADFEGGNVYAHYKQLNAAALAFFDRSLKAQATAWPAGFV
jgi:predicted dienelactone hydrolase